MKAADGDKLNQIIADDWVALGPDGKTETKQAFLAGYKSGKSKTESYDFGPINVKVLGNVAIVQGSDTEKSMSDGQDSSGKCLDGCLCEARRQVGCGSFPARQGRVISSRKLSRAQENLGPAFVSRQSHHVDSRPLRR